MTKVDYWATAPWDRQQHLLFSHTLDEAVREDHPVRVVDDILSGLDWTEWEAAYPHTRGRPPIHPRKLAGLLLYGLTSGLRSSRSLEAACQNHLDIMWLMEGLVPDHSTICSFRTAHGKQLKSLFRQVCRLAAEMGLVQLNRVAIDGTAMRANSSRHRTLTREKIEKRLLELEGQIEQMLQEAAAADDSDNERLGASSGRLPAGLEDARQRKKKLQEALKTIDQLDQSKKKEGVKTKSQLPETDPDSRILPNKEGGFAPNYTGIVSADAACGFIIDATVIQGNAEAEQAVPAVRRIAETFERTPDSMLADGHFAQGHVLEAMEDLNVPLYSPLKSSEPQEGNPAHRADPTQAVPESEWDQLPYRDRKKTQLDKAAFVFVPEEDVYYCPQGRRLPFAYQEHQQQGERTVTSRRYQAEDCSGCPLASRCLSRGQRRTIRRDQYSEVRERHARKMQTAEAQVEYQARMGTAEPRFGTLKGNWRFRQFLLRGIEKVEIEFRWVCLALNIKKFVTYGAAPRAAAAGEG